MVKEVMEGKPVIITYRGKPAAAITSLNEDVGSCMLGAGCCELGNSSDPTMEKIAALKPAAVGGWRFEAKAEIGKAAPAFFPNNLNFPAPMLKMTHLPSISAAPL